MTKTSRLQIRISPETKARGEEFFESMGLTMSSAVNMFIHQCLSDGKLPFNKDMNRPRSSGGGNKNLQ